jgi:hypothetical protein
MKWLAVLSFARWGVSQSFRRRNEAVPTPKKTEIELSGGNLYARLAFFTLWVRSRSRRGVDWRRPARPCDPLLADILGR